MKRLIFSSSDERDPSERDRGEEVGNFDWFDWFDWFD